MNLKGKLIFKKYKIISLLDKGSFGLVYLGQNIISHKLYAIKLENDNSSQKILKEEAFILYNLKGFGIPEVISYGHSGRFNILVQTLLGRSLEKIWLEKNKKFNLKDICMIAIQTLERIEFIHSNYYLHRDIKPANFLVGSPDSSIIYLIDFGNAKKYRSSRTGKHIQSLKINRINGTILFLSLNSMRGNQQSRKDDLESLGYMYIYLAKGCLPWSNVKNKQIKDSIIETGKMKASISIENLCKNLPKEFCEFMRNVKSLKFEQKPDYNYLRNLFNKILTRIGEKNDNLFSWINKINFPRDNSQKNHSLSKKKKSPQMRLLHKIELNLNKKYINNIDNNCFDSIIVNDRNNVITEENEIIKNNNNINELKIIEKNYYNQNNIINKQNQMIEKMKNQSLGNIKKINNSPLNNTGLEKNKIQTKIVYNNNIKLNEYKKKIQNFPKKDNTKKRNTRNKKIILINSILYQNNTINNIPYKNTINNNNKPPNYSDNNTPSKNRYKKNIISRDIFKMNYINKNYNTGINFNLKNIINPRITNHSIFDNNKNLKLVNKINLRYKKNHSSTVNVTPNKNLINQNSNMINNKEMIYRRIQNKNKPNLINYRNINLKNKILIRQAKSQDNSKIHNLDYNDYNGYI